MLWQKFCCELQRILKGQFLKELLLADEKLAKRKPPLTVNGRQLAWMVRRKSDVDETQQNTCCNCKRTTPQVISLNWTHGFSKSR